MIEIGTKPVINLKEKAISALPIGLFYSLGLFGLDNLGYNEPEPFWTYVLQGAFFGMAMSFLINPPIFSHFYARSYLKGDPHKSNMGKIIAKGPANLMTTFEAVGGQLLLIDEKLIFDAHLLNFQRMKTEIRLDQINKIETFKTFFTFQNGLKISTEDKSYRFVVKDRNLWKEIIKEHL